SRIDNSTSAIRILAPSNRSAPLRSTQSAQRHFQPGRETVMQIVRSVGSLAAALLILLVRVPSVALDVTLDSGAGSQTIVDNDAFDMDITVGTIEFDVTVGGKLAARARVREEVATIVRAVNIAAIPPDTHATFRNVGLAAATFTITVNTSSY